MQQSFVGFSILLFTNSSNAVVTTPKSKKFILQIRIGDGGYEDGILRMHERNVSTQRHTLIIYKELSTFLHLNRGGFIRAD